MYLHPSILLLHPSVHLLMTKDWSTPSSFLSSSNPRDNHSIAYCTNNISVPDIRQVEYSTYGETLFDTISLYNQTIDPSVSHDTNVTIQKVNVTKADQLSSLRNYNIPIEMKKIIPFNVSNAYAST